MTGIPTWHERAMAYPDHQSGMVSEEMIRARMGEEIADLRAEVERLHRAHQAACEGGDLLCVEIKRLTRERDEAREEVDRLRKEMREIAEDCESEYPQSYKKIARGIRDVLEAKP